MRTVDYTAVDHLVELLRAHDLVVDVDPSRVVEPGIWVETVGLSFDLLGDYTHKLRLRLVVPDNGYVESRDALADLLTQVIAAGVMPDADPFLQPVILPAGPKALPGLAVPLDLPATFRHDQE